MSNFAICDRFWPLTCLKFPTATSDVPSGVAEICRTLGTDQEKLGLCTPLITPVKYGS